MAAHACSLLISVLCKVIIVKFAFIFMQIGTTIGYATILYACNYCADNDCFLIFLSDVMRYLPNYVSGLLVDHCKSVQLCMQHGYNYHV